jgi:phosphorylcholine metabolism protein LicD
MDFGKRIRVLEDGKKALDKVGVNFWLEGGVLLGFYRDGNFIEHDNDIDFIVMSEEVYSRLKDIKQSLIDLGFSVSIKKHYKYGVKPKGILKKHRIKYMVSNEFSGVLKLDSIKEELFAGKTIKLTKAQFRNKQVKRAIKKGILVSVIDIEAEEIYNKYGAKTKNASRKRRSKYGKKHRIKIHATKDNEILCISSYFLNAKNNTRVRVPHRFLDRLFGSGNFIEIAGTKYPCPYPIEEYLETAYGDWRTLRTQKEVNRLAFDPDSNTGKLYKIYEKLSKSGMYKYFDKIPYQGLKILDGE